MIQQQASISLISQLNAIEDASVLKKTNSLKSVIRTNFMVSFLFFIAFKNFSQLYNFK
jgi:hypothetical protein